MFSISTNLLYANKFFDYIIKGYYGDLHIDAPNLMCLSVSTTSLIVPCWSPILADLVQLPREHNFELQLNTNVRRCMKKNLKKITVDKLAVIGNIMPFPKMFGAILKMKETLRAICVSVDGDRDEDKDTMQDLTKFFKWNNCTSIMIKAKSMNYIAFVMEMMQRGVFHRPSVEQRLTLEFRLKAEKVEIDCALMSLMNTFVYDLKKTYKGGVLLTLEFEMGSAVVNDDFVAGWPENLIFDAYEPDVVVCLAWDTEQIAE